MRTPLSRPRFFTPAARTLISLLLSACGGTVPNQVIVPPAPVAVASPPVRTNASWPYHPATRRQRFVIDQHAIVSTHVDTTTTTDTVSLHGELAVLASTELGLSGELTAFAVGGAPAVTLNLPVPFRASYPGQNRQLAFDAPAETSPCASRELAAMQSFRDLWFRPSDTLRVGATWRDSSSYVLCRGGIPLNATVARTFVVTAESGPSAHPVLTVSRTSRTAIAGAGLSLGEAVEVSGSGTETLTYTLDPVAGEVVSANGGVTLDLTMRNQLRGVPRIQSVHQAAEIRIERR